MKKSLKSVDVAERKGRSFDRLVWVRPVNEMGGMEVGQTKKSRPDVKPGRVKQTSEVARAESPVRLRAPYLSHAPLDEPSAQLRVVLVVPLPPSMTGIHSPASTHLASRDHFAVLRVILL